MRTTSSPAPPLMRVVVPLGVPLTLKTSSLASPSRISCGVEYANGTPGPALSVVAVWFIVPPAALASVRRRLVAWTEPPAAPVKPLPISRTAGAARGVIGAVTVIVPASAPPAVRPCGIDPIDLRIGDFELGIRIADIPQVNRPARRRGLKLHGSLRGENLRTGSMLSRSALTTTSPLADSRASRPVATRVSCIRAGAQHDVGASGPKGFDRGVAAQASSIAISPPAWRSTPWPVFEPKASERPSDDRRTRCRRPPLSEDHWLPRRRCRSSLPRFQSSRHRSR